MLKFIRNALMAGGLVCMLASGAIASELNGQQWGASTQQEKMAFLYGAASVVAIEYAISEQAKTTPTIFVQKWVQTFKNADLKSLCQKIDDWYATHPEQHTRHVFDVLWYDFLAPGTRK